MARKPKAPPPTNRFEVTTTVHIPPDQARSVMRWLNLHYTGKEEIPLDEKVNAEHVQSHWNLHAGKNVRLTFDVDVNGRWTLVEAKT